MKLKEPITLADRFRKTKMFKVLEEAEGAGYDLEPLTCYIEEAQIAVFIKNETLIIIQMKADESLIFKKFPFTISYGSPDWIRFKKCLAVDFKNSKGEKAFSKPSYYVFILVGEYDPPG
jgi:hypothetical protein